MILVGRPAAMPAALARGVALTQIMQQDWDAFADEYRTGARKFKFSKSVYGPKAVKDSLARAQFEKCCYCEGGDFRAHVAGDVEHYRPKGSVKTDVEEIYPGYYWLAYSPTNLYFACPDCNAYRKRSRFPLKFEIARARNHHDPLGAEQPLLLDPAGPQNPRDHIRFARDQPVGVTEEGRVTIEVLHLDRDQLTKKRRKLIGRLQGDLDTIASFENNPDPAAIERVTRAHVALQDAVQPHAEFSAMAQDFLAGWTPN